MAVALLAIAVFVPFLGRDYLYDWDEAWYGQVAKELLRSGDWITLHWRGHPFFDKPPLGIWAIAASFATFGRSEWTARLPSVVASVACLFLMLWIGWMLFGRIRPALLSACVLGTSLPFVKAGRMAMLDVPVTAAISLAVAAYLAARKDRRWGVVVGIAAGIAWMIKGPLAILAIGLLVVFALWERDLGTWRTPWFPAGFLLGLALCLPWYLAEVQRQGEAFLAAHFGHHILARATTVLDGHRGPWWFYLARIAMLDEPWFLVLVASLPLLWRQRHQAWVRLGVSWTVVVVVPFSIVATKLPWYVVPAYPALALLAAGALDALPIQARRPWLPWALVGGTLAILLGFVATTLNWEERYAPDLRPLAHAADRVPGSGILTLARHIRPAFIYYLDHPEIRVDRKQLVARWPEVRAAVLTDPQWQALAASLPDARVAATTSGQVLVLGQDLRYTRSP